jgi:integrase
MLALIGQSLLADTLAQPRCKPVEISDTRLAGFTLRVQPSGVRAYYARIGRNRRIALGKVGTISPNEARDQCQRILGNVAAGRHPQEGVAGTAGTTLGQFLLETYEPWARTNRPRTARNTLEKLRLLFKPWMSEPLSALTVERIELWKGRRLQSGVKATTLLRELFALSSVLTRAVRVGQLASNPIRQVEKPRFDRRPRVRFLSVDEEARLREVLADRDRQMREARVSGNAHHASRNEPRLPDLPYFGDHLTPAVLLSMNTGLRMGETRRLRWDWIDLDHRWLTLDGAHAKTRQTRHIPLNEEAYRVLVQWREQAGASPRLFPVATCFKTAWSHALQRAGIVGFRWHDLRHHFASRLVQAGVPLNTVRDLLGHASVAMSLRYAHLAPDQRCQAVARLDNKPVLTAAMQVPWRGQRSSGGPGDLPAPVALINVAPMFIETGTLDLRL